MLSLVCLVVQEAVEYDSMVVVMVRECRGRWLVCRWQSSSSSSSLVVVVVATKLRSCQRNYEAANFVRFFTLTATDCDRLRPTTKAYLLACCLPPPLVDSLTHSADLPLRMYNTCDVGRVVGCRLSVVSQFDSIRFDFDSIVLCCVRCHFLLVGSCRVASLPRCLVASLPRCLVASLPRACCRSSGSEGE